MQYTVSYRDLEGNIVKDKKFNTRQEQEEEYESLLHEDIGHKIILNDEWYHTRYFRKVGSEYVIGVSEV